MPKSTTTAAVAAEPSATAVYALGRDPAESARLQRQSGELRSASAALLDRTGLRPGQAAIDLGCGPSGIIELLAERVSPGGRVVGLDADPAHVAMARELARQRGLGHVEIVAADARRTGLPSGSFDLVHARTLLVTLPQPAAVVAEMVRLARPGGWVAGLEADAEYSLCYPPQPAWDRLCEIFHASFTRNGADLLIGRRLTELYREAGLEDIGVEARAGVYRATDSRRTVRADLVRSMRPMIVEMGLADERELDELDRAVRQHLDDPRTLVMPHLSFLAWGRKPEAGPAGWGALAGAAGTGSLSARRRRLPVLRPRVPAERVVGWDFDQDDPDAVGVLDPHLSQPPGLGHRLPQNARAGRGQALMLGVDIPHLEPEPHGVTGAAGRVPGDFQEPRAEKEDHAGIGRRAELPVDRQAQHIPVETLAAAQVGRPQQDPAAQYLHTTPPPRPPRHHPGSRRSGEPDGAGVETRGPAPTVQ
jgi:ubiquinone/menaquinone biosynthesis C-methylase UbiE